jgi:hypothetical protein
MGATTAGATGGAIGVGEGTIGDASAGRARSASRSARRLIGTIAVVWDESIGTSAAVATSAYPTGAVADVSRRSSG